MRLGVKIVAKNAFNAMDWAASGGHLEVVKWLNDNSEEGCTRHAMDIAAFEGHLDVVKWLHENCRENSSTNSPYK